MTQAKILQFPFRAAAENRAVLERSDEAFKEGLIEDETETLLSRAVLMKHSMNENTRRRAQFVFDELRRRGVNFTDAAQL